jgi:hypothetical protein
MWVGRIAVAPGRTFRRERLIAPRVRSQHAATRLLMQMRELGSDQVLSNAAWRTATRLPVEYAAGR